MSKRVSLSDREIQYIIDGLTNLKNATNLDYQVIKTGKQVYQDIINKLMDVTTATTSDPDTNNKRL